MNDQTFKTAITLSKANVELSRKNAELVEKNDMLELQLETAQKCYQELLDHAESMANQLDEMRKREK